MTTQVIRPVFSAETIQQRQQDHDELVKAIMTPDCFDEIGGELRPNKTYFRRISFAYGVDVSKVSEEQEYVACNPDLCSPKCEGNHYEARFIVRATHRETGAYMDGDGSCIDNEKWPIRRKRLSKKQRDLIFKLCAEKKVEDKTKTMMAERVSGGRVNDLRNLNPQEASELLDFLFGNTPSLEPVLAIRNTRHNVRGTARTRAVNRAISDLVAGGIVSAEEIVRGHEYTDKKKGAQNNPPAQNNAPAKDAPPANAPARQPAAQQQGKAAPAQRQRETTQPAPAATLIQPRQKQTIEKLSKAKNISGATLRDMIRRATNGAKEAVEQLTEFEAGQFIRSLQKPEAA